MCTSHQLFTIQTNKVFDYYSHKKYSRLPLFKITSVIIYTECHEIFMECER